jgi:hypothetical protein
MRFDLPDALLVLGVLVTITGVALVHRPAAVVLAGLLCMLLALAFERRKPRR